MVSIYKALSVCPSVNTTSTLSAYCSSEYVFDC